MSGKLFGKGLEAAMPSHVTKLVLLKLLDACEPDGTHIYPGMKSISKAAQVSERQAQRVMRLFTNSKLLILVAKGGRGPGDTARYRLDMGLFERLHTEGWESVFGPIGDALKGKTKNRTETKGDATAGLEKGDVSADKGDVLAPMGEAEASPDPSIDPPLDPLRENARASDSAASKWDFLPPDEALIDGTFEALAAAWGNGAKGGRGAIGNSMKARAAIADLPETDHAIAIERAPRFLRALKDANKYALTIETYVKGREFTHHPPPANADPAAIQPVELKPYVVPLWAMYWKAIHKARHATGDDRHIRRLRDCTDWLERGVTTPAGMIPGEDDIASLVPIKIDSPEHLAWQDFAVRIGARLPRPDHVPVIYVPAAWPPPLTLTGTKPYRLAMPVRVEVRGQAWWWRFWKSIEDGTPIVSTLAGRHRVDLLEAARRTSGATEVDYGPIPLASEISAMVEVKPLTDAFEQWSTWISAQGGDLAMWPHGSIWCPSEYPTLIFGQGKTEAGAAA